MRLALVATLIACSNQAPPFRHPRTETLPSLAIHKIIHRDDNGIAPPDAVFGVVLTRAVTPDPVALTLSDDRVGAIRGDVVWLDRQVVAFYPRAPLGDGLDLHLRLAATLRSSDGETIAPRELLRTQTRPIKFLSVTLGETPPRPVSTVDIYYERGIPPTDYESLGVLSADGLPLPFTTRDLSGGVRLFAVLPPGKTISFRWKDEHLSVGRVEPVTLSAVVATGLHVMRFGEPDDRCTYKHVCERELVHLVFDSPVTQAEVDAHMHPPGKLATTGDTRGHRVELSATSTPTTLSIDAAMRDVFGQTLAAPYKITFQRK